MVAARRMDYGLEPPWGQHGGQVWCCWQHLRILIRKSIMASISSSLCTCDYLNRSRFDALFRVCSWWFFYAQVLGDVENLLHMRIGRTVAGKMLDQERQVSHLVAEYDVMDYKSVLIPIVVHLNPKKSSDPPQNAIPFKAGWAAALDCPAYFDTCEVPHDGGVLGCKNHWIARINEWCDGRFPDHKRGRLAVVTDEQLLLWWYCHILKYCLWLKNSQW